ncbi:hypothetical protein [Sulfurisphaera javensis]|uniref:hypothetical protein n=1 Tax=Sulfurisphaera javensis TaxID=2049879 RepID=UPI0034E8B75F
MPISEIKLDYTLCKGLYYSSWVKKIGKGYFVRLLDHHVYNEETLENAIQTLMKIEEYVRPNS